MRFERCNRRFHCIKTPRPPHARDAHAIQGLSAPQKILFGAAHRAHQPGLICEVEYRMQRVDRREPFEARFCLVLRAFQQNQLREWSGSFVLVSSKRYFSSSEKTRGSPRLDSPMASRVALHNLSHGATGSTR